MKAPLGLLAFLVGLVVVFVAFVPGALGNVMAQHLEEHFALNHAGSIQIDEAWMGSIFGRQSIKAVVLNDVDGNEVLRASVNAPSLAPVLHDLDAAWGPVLVTVEELELVEDRSGLTRLHRALARTESPKESALDNLQIDLNFNTYEIDVSLKKVTYTDRDGRRIELVDVHLSVAFTGLGDGNEMTVSGRATVPGGAAGALRFGYEVPRIGARAWGVALDAEPISVALVELLLPPLAGLGEVFGNQLQVCHVRVEVDANGVRRVQSARVSNDSVQLELSGTWMPDTGCITARAGDLARLRIRDASLAARFVQCVIPIVEDIQFESAEPMLEFQMTDFVLPIDGTSDQLVATGVMDAGPWGFRYLAPMHGSVVLDDTYSASGALSIDVAGGRVQLSELSLSASGGALELDGSSRFDGSNIRLFVTLPGNRTYDITGSRTDLKIE